MSSETFFIEKYLIIWIFRSLLKGEDRYEFTKDIYIL